MLGANRNNVSRNSFVNNPSSYLSGVSDFVGKLHPNNTITGKIYPSASGGTERTENMEKVSIEHLLSSSILRDLAGSGAIRLVPTAPLSNPFSAGGTEQTRFGQSSPHVAQSDLLDKLAFLIEAQNAPNMGFEHHFGNASPLTGQFDAGFQQPSFDRQMQQHQYQAFDGFAHTNDAHANEPEVTVEKPINANVNLYGRSPYETTHAIEDTLAKAGLAGSALTGAAGAYLQFGGPVDGTSTPFRQTLNALTSGKELMALGGLGAAIAAASLYANHRSNKAMEEKREQELAFM